MKTKLKKLTALLMALMLLLATFGCSSDSDKGDKKEKEGVEDSESKDDEATGADSEEDGGQSQSTFKNAKVGDYITFGKYEQDNNTSNGKEDIEWLVLDVQDGKALVISKYGLDCKPYNTNYTDVTWETCSLRSWLNDEFINEAFSDDEIDKILITTVETPKNVRFGTNGGGTTNDKVFILSIQEANKYLGEKEMICEPIPGYYEYDEDEENDDTYNWWWLRTPGKMIGDIASVASSGTIDEWGDNCYSDCNGVRPAMWVDVDKIITEKK